MINDRWIVRPLPRDKATARLLCFPCAGGVASAFRSWAEVFEKDVEVCAVQLPGRQRRISEPALRQVSEAVTPLLESTNLLCNGNPVGLLGDCTGAFLAFELARAMLLQESVRSPRHLFVISCRAPHLPLRQRPLHNLPMEELRRDVRKLKIAPEWLLQSESAFREFQALLRADFEMTETYTYAPGAPLTIPITAFAGKADTTIELEEVEAWGELTNDRFELHYLDSDHDVCKTHRDHVIASITSQLHKELS